MMAGNMDAAAVRASVIIKNTNTIASLNNNNNENNPPFSSSPSTFVEECKYFLKVDTVNLGWSNTSVSVVRSFEIEEIILEERPIIKVPFCKQFGSITCLGCLEFRSLNKLGNLWYCKKCDWPLCSEKCLKNKAHTSNECRIFAAKNILPSYSIQDYENIQVLRCLLLKKNNLVKWKKMQSIMGPAKCIAEEKLEEFVKFIKETCGLKEFHANVICEVANAIGRHAFNNINEFCVAEDKTASYLYEIGSKFAHCCAPNSSWQILHNGSLEIKALRKINIGENITISHAPLLYGTCKRRVELKKRYGFWCRCKLCLDPTEFGTYFSGMTCTDCGIGVLLPAKPVEVDTLWSCSRCSFQTTSSNIDQFLQRTEKEIELSMTRSESEQNHSIVKLQHCLEKYEKKMLHPNHYLIYRIRNEIILRCWNLLAEKFRLVSLHYKNFSKILISSAKKCMELAEVFWPGNTVQRGRLLACIFYGYHHLLQMETENRVRVRGLIIQPRKTYSMIKKPYGSYEDLSQLFQDACKILLSVPDDTNGEQNMADLLKEIAEKEKKFHVI